MSTDRTSEAEGRDIAVIVPSYNHAQFLEACLRSIFVQSQPPRELLVIDDASTDGSVASIDGLLQECRFPSELIVHATNRGLGATLNEGLAKTRAPTLAYLASDDIWLTGRLRSASDALEQHFWAVASFGTCLLIDAEGRVLNAAAFNTMEGHRLFAPRHVDLNGLLQFRTIPLAPGVTYRRWAVELAGGWNEHCPTEDYEMYLRLVRLGEFAWVSGSHAAWRLHAGQTSKDLDTMLQTALDVQQRLAPTLGPAAKKVAHYQCCVRYTYGEYFLRRAGRANWRRGADLTLGNLSGAPRSPSALVERAARLVLAAAACLKDQPGSAL
jgi:alpha-1,3-rhamnosyltransferase